MQNRYRWYRIQLPSGVTDLGEIISAHPFDPNVNYGFLTIHGLAKTSTYRFLIRSKVAITLLDSSGIPSCQEIDSVNVTDFSVLNLDSALFLRVENPGRNIRDLLNAIEGLVGLGFVCKPVTFEHARPSRVFEHITSVKMIALKVTGAVFDVDLVARMDFSSKQGITLDKLHILDGVHHKIESASYELIYEGVKGQLAFASNGAVKVSGQLAPKLLHLIEQDLCSVS